MLNVGLTGGIGSGKSTVADIFAKLSIPVYHADDRAKYLMNHDDLLRTSIIDLFGKEVYDTNGLNRKYLASIVFNDVGSLAKLNDLVHPAVRADYSAWCKEQDAPYNIREAAILFESGAYADCDLVVLVSAPENIRIERVMKRDGSSEEEVRARMKNQWTDEKRKELAHFFIDNEDFSTLEDQVFEVHRSIIHQKRNRKS